MKAKAILVFLIYYSLASAFSQSLGIDKVFPDGSEKGVRRAYLQSNKNLLYEKAGMILATMQIPITAGSIMINDTGVSTYGVTVGGGLSYVIMIADATLDNTTETYTIKPSVYIGPTIVGGYTPITSDNSNVSGKAIIGGIFGAYDYSLIFGYDLVDKKFNLLFGAKIDSFKFTDALTVVIGKPWPR